jgi:hypothetical protein
VWGSAGRGGFSPPPDSQRLRIGVA